MKNREQFALREQIGDAVQVTAAYLSAKSFELQVKYHSVRCFLKVGILVALEVCEFNFHVLRPAKRKAPTCCDGRQIASRPTFSSKKLRSKK